MGKCIAAQVIVDTNVLKHIKKAEKYAYYSGVAPCEHSSGSSVDSRSCVSHRANKRSKTLLHMVAMSATCRAGELKAYYERKVAAGKHKMLVMSSMRNQFILRIFACVPDNSVYQNYVHALVSTIEIVELINQLTSLPILKKRCKAASP